MKDDHIQPNSAIAVAIFVVSENGNIPLVRDPKKPTPIYWKLPGGRGEAGEDALAAATRELQEELGIDTPLELVYQENRGNHTFSLFKSSNTSLEGMNVQGNEHEEIQVFTKEEIAAMGDSFFPPHRKILTAQKLL